MAQTKQQIQRLLAEAGAHPRHRLGQNFMIDANLVRIVADAGMISPGDLVIEVGPGTGTLTEELLVRRATVVAVEIDRMLAELLRNRFAAAGNFSLIEADALAGKHALDERVIAEIQRAKSAGQTVRLVANLPYNIASPLLIEMLIAGVDLLAFTVQKEVADRLRSGPNSAQYGTLSIMTQLLSRVELLRTLPPQAFWPMPGIESALVRLTRDDRLSDRAAGFGSFVQRIFSSRRKTLRNALAKAGGDAEKSLAAAGLNGQSRPEEICPQDFLRLFDAALA
ncbi:MAG TPA: 16S rRNA (adenine(1518)-N(6)/adenine(1519)-N(6))-dimethyltransferase RsmA [Tepidisphaeraceae bacterium]|jgi:16S rRNA (adenine1518-N6/adenine1519-N6)-dimethyltransferase|nr:16S rRNA (adenine(1518)-N(6)/adenine(1519)-N(6))-dimethyltransferase RsmA [Tepidisphaeraceae bacterium]